MFPINWLLILSYTLIQKTAIGNLIDFHFEEEDCLNFPVLPPNHILNLTELMIKLY